MKKETKPEDKIEIIDEIKTDDKDEVFLNTKDNLEVIDIDEVLM